MPMAFQTVGNNLCVVPYKYRNLYFLRNDTQVIPYGVNCQFIARLFFTAPFIYFCKKSQQANRLLGLDYLKIECFILDKRGCKNLTQSFLGKYVIRLKIIYTLYARLSLQS